MYVVVGHHCCDDQGVVIGVIDEVCITFFESDVVVLPLELLCRLLIHAVDIGERPILHLPDVTIWCPTCLPGKVRSTEDHPDLTWGFCLKSVILWSCPPVINIMLEVPTANELLDLILEGDALLSGMTNVLVEPTVLILLPLGEVSM